MHVREAEWIAVDGDDNAESNAIKAAVTGGRHVVTMISASFATAPATAKLLQLLHGSSVVWETYLTTAVNIPIPSGIRNPNVNESVTAKLAASGTGGVVSKVALFGYTI